MDATSRFTQPKDRPFDPSRIPVSAAAQQLVSEVLGRARSGEQRVRRRSHSAEGVRREAVTALVSDLACRLLREADSWLTVEMSKADLTPANRRAPFMTEGFRHLVHTLASSPVGILELRMGHKSALESIRSTVRAAPWLIGRIDALGLSLGDFGRNPSLLGDSLILRGRKVRGQALEIPVPETEEAAQLRQEMSEVNGMLAQADLSYAGCEVEDRVDLSQRFLRRIFNDASLQRGGRLYHGFWQEMGRELRSQYLRIEGQPIASVDFAQMSVHLAYAQVGTRPPEGDLYFIPGVGGSRHGVKQVMNALLASDKVPTRMPQGTRHLFPARVKIRDVVQGIRERHPALEPLFGSSQWALHQNTESRVILRSILRLKELGLVALPVHDCLLVRYDKAQVAREVMELAFEEVSGGKGHADVDLSPSAQALVGQVRAA